MAVHHTLAPLHTALRHLRDNGPALPEYGVLWNVRHLIGRDSAIEISLLQLLREYYGSVYNATTAHTEDPTGWDSPRRIALLDWLIHTITIEQETHAHDTIITSSALRRV